MEMNQLHILKFDYSDLTSSLDGYYGYFIIDGIKVDIRLLSKNEITNLMDNESEYFVPLIVRSVDKFNLDDKIVYTNDYGQQYIFLCDDENFLKEVNLEPHKHFLVVVDEEDSSTLDKILNDK